VQIPMLGRELDAAMELIGEVFSVGGDEVKRMIKERMESRGMIRGRRREMEDDHEGRWSIGGQKEGSFRDKRSPAGSPRGEKRIKESTDEDLGL